MSDELVLHGRFGRSVKVQGSNIIITSGVISARNKTIPIRNISSVDIKEPGMFNGYIQFVLSGGQHLNSTFSFSGGSLDAAKDENSVVFQSSENFEIAIKIKQFIESYDSSPRSSLIINLCCCFGSLIQNISLPHSRPGAMGHAGIKIKY
jgi:hypothetical protein